MQYTIAFDIFIDTLGVFSDNFAGEAEEYDDLRRSANLIFEKINFNLFEFSYLAKKDVKNLKSILMDDNYLKLLSLCGSYCES